MTETHPIKTFPSIQGRCPACRGDSLFIGSGGYVTCSRIDCPDPCAADDLLHRPEDYDASWQQQNDGTWALPIRDGGGVLTVPARTTMGERARLASAWKAVSTPDPAPAATQPTDGTVCTAYQPPTTAEMTGLCARCGMYDYRHTTQQARADAVGVDPIDPIDQYRRLKIELEHWQTVIVPELRAQRDRATTALGETLAVFSPVSSHNGVRIGWTAAHPIHPDDYDRWTAALPKGRPDA
ncbi:DUF6085 family protein [Streptomyces sp. NPDC004658]|uniref:DUF6085 family protein n=1 Tax=Streptomyces sp. NPDC004658 TaxID=3154672 RepID=UPI0033A22EEB